ncbi:MAG: NifB/NifX family molybdenum-iron cluster-binding protein [Coriobacteriia bacterium]|nr:NifB/NifX family molybdenum-iron cluster-binding protein [Coriobacteriia bacterium]
MRIAVSCDGLDVARRFGFAESLTVYTVENGIVTRCQNMPHPHDTPTHLLELFQSLGISMLICGLINVEEARLYCALGVEVIAGAVGPARQAMEAALTRHMLGLDEMCDDDDEVTCCTI